MGFIRFSGVLLGFAGFCWVLLGFTGFYWVLLGFTGFYWVLLFFLLSFYWVVVGFNGLSTGSSLSLPSCIDCWLRCPWSWYWDGSEPFLCNSLRCHQICGRGTFFRWFSFYVISDLAMPRFGQRRPGLVGRFATWFRTTSFLFRFDGNFFWLRWLFLSASPDPPTENVTEGNFSLEIDRPAKGEARPATRFT